MEQSQPPQAPADATDMQAPLQSATQTSAAASASASAPAFPSSVTDPVTSTSSSQQPSDQNPPPPADTSTNDTPIPTAIKNEPADVDVAAAATDQGPSALTSARASPSANPSPAPNDNSADVSATAEDTVMEDAVTYGTRSRNRTTGARPNYAEDQDMDFEYTAPAKSRNSDSKRSSNVNDSKLPAINDAKDSGASTPIAAPAPAPATKKRKAALAVSSTTSSATTPAPTTAVRKAVSAASSTVRRPETNMYFFDKSKSKLNKNGQLVADDGTVFNVDDHVYLVSEPPGEPYYIGRVMEFVRSSPDEPSSPIIWLRINWYYRSRDVLRHNTDTRLIYGTMHSDLCPVTSLRGKCHVHHRAEIEDLDQYRKQPDHFWFNQVNDRFIKRFYEVIPVSQVINVPEKVKKALDERWKYVVVEPSRVKEFTSAVKLCKRCSQYCANNDSVTCALCGDSWHMECLRPPIPKKPSRGFAWACGPCSRAQEKALEARHTPNITAGGDGDEEMLEEEEEEEEAVLSDSTRAPSPEPDERPPTEAELALAKMWPMRYLGIHCRVEDVLDYNDASIYPRASSRLGPKHQIDVIEWPGRPMELIKPAEIKKKYLKGPGVKKDSKLSKETIAAIEADRAAKSNRPPWMVDEPPGYVARGEDYPNNDPRNTAELIFKMPPDDADHSPAANEEFIDKFMTDAQGLAKVLRVSEYGVNLMDKALSILINNNYDSEKALKILAKADREKDLKEPILTHDDLKKFEEGVAKYGSEHRLIKQHMKGSVQPISAIIRFYYLWKTTSRGKSIWGNYPGRKNAKKRSSSVETEEKLDIGDDADDSAYDTGKAHLHKKEFQCKFCSRRNSPQWRRAPAHQTAAPEKSSAKDKAAKPILALCLRCAGLWRKYAIQWEEQDELAKKAAAGGGKAWKRRIDEELLKELQIESNMGSQEVSEAENTPDPSSEPARKKSKTDPAASKPKAPAVKLPTPPPPPIVPDEPRFRDLPCFVCKAADTDHEGLVTCTHCKLTVHRHCYGITDQVASNKWICDQCTNDKAPLVSTDYACTLCPIDFTPWEIWDQPRTTHKKKTDRDKEKERLEKILLDKAKLDFFKRQTELSRPLQPREPLKKTDGNNWVHVLCAVWTPEIKFSDSKRFEKAEGFSLIPPNKYEAMCKLCKNARHGACVSCQHCHANFHVACAFEAGYTFGFDVTPVKGSRKDQVTSVSVGAETGHMTPAIWCIDHTIKTIVHPMDEVVDKKGTTALQLYVENYKQADQTLTGTARKANLLSQMVRAQAQVPAPAVGVNRRISSINPGVVTSARKARPTNGSVTDENDMNEREGSATEQVDKKCTKCGIEVSPKWWPLPDPAVHAVVNGTNGTHATDGKTFECHKCHYKATKPPKRIPLSPKIFDINLEWPPCLSEPERHPGWDRPPPFGAPMDPHGYPRPPDWGFAPPPPYGPGRGPLPPMPPHMAPQPNGYPFPHPEGPPPPGFYDRGRPPPPGYQPAPGPHPMAPPLAPHQSPHQPPFAPRQSASPFGAPVAVVPAGSPDTPKGADGRPGASNSPHIGNLLS